jgi:hypothetical protein
MRKMFFITLVSFTLLTACTETKEEGTSSSVQESASTGDTAEMVSLQDSLRMAAEKTADSLEQVKTHGHAH